MQRAALALAALCGAAALLSTEELIAVAQSPGGRPLRAPVDVDCAWRPLALEFAAHVQPWLTAAQLSAIHDSLFAGTQCNASAADALLAAHAPAPPPRPPPRADPPTLYVDPTSGSDANPGTQALPLRSLAAALNASRALHAPGAPAVIALRAGTHYLGATLRLSPLDSGLAFAAFAGEAPVVSGALSAQGLAWTLATNTTGAWAPVQNNSNAVYGACPSPAVPDEGAMPSWQACQASCQANASCTAWTYHTPACAGCAGFIGHCCWRTDGEYAPTPQGGVVSQGRAPGRVVWRAPLALPAGLRSVGALQLNGHRATLARYPNADAEVDLFPKGYIAAAQWLAPLPAPVCDETLTVDLAPLGLADAGRGIYINYTVGLGGNAARYDPPRALWASRDFGPQAGQPTATCDRWAEMHTRSPRALDTGAALAGRLPYADTSQLIVRSWRLAHWYSWMFRVNGTNGSVLSFGEPGPEGGGHQGGEGCDEGQEWWVEGVAEELDAPNEFFHDADAGVLYLFPNSTDADPATGAPPSALQVPLLHTFFSLYGSQEDPVRNVSFSGITFTGGRPTFMEPRGQPSGGDWALERLGALLLEGTEDVSVSGCLFTRIDGNAVFLSGYNRRAAITQNEFVWLGQSAIASWGRTDEWDGTGGQQPRFTRVAGNVAHELGNLQKQSSFYFSAASCQATLEGNIVYNIPRAAINIDDGFGGGNEFARNLLYNTCRESSDHGAFNSWDRMPFVTMVRDGVTPSSIPADNTFHHSFVVANYAADGGCLDNDDGSAWYLIHDNFCMYSGAKSDFDGHSKRSIGNLHAYASVYGARCVDIGAQHLPVAGFQEAYVNNTCIVDGEEVYDIPFTDAYPPHAQVVSAAAFQARFVSGGNTIHAASAGRALGPFANFEAFAASGYEVGPPSTVNTTLPTAAEIVAWARAMLWQ